MACCSYVEVICVQFIRTDIPFKINVFLLDMSTPSYKPLPISIIMRPLKPLGNEHKIILFIINSGAFNPCFMV